jgi:hypothetical protein
MTDPYHEWADRELMDEHDAHPGRFARYVVQPKKTMNTELERYRSDALGWKAEAERWRELAESSMTELTKAREAIRLLSETARELNDVINPKP